MNVTDFKYFRGFKLLVQLMVDLPSYGSSSLGTEAGVAHSAYLGGMLFGCLLLLYLRRHTPGYRQDRH